jgi:glyoxylase-like metal-dependent hydrolase (beta-lactamase superfamily II)
MQFIPLSEGTFTVDKSKLFVPFNEKEHDLLSRPTGSLLVEIQPFVVITSKDILLLDSGLGYIKDGRLQIHKNLSEAGINPTDITKVLLTHLHKDHAGGVSTGHEHQHLSFPNATYFVQEKELNFAFEKGLPSFIPEELMALKRSPQVVLLKEDEGSIDSYIHFKTSGAHSPYHQVFWIKENTQTIFFGGDEAPQLQQMKHRFAAKYDFNGKKAMGLRSEWWQLGQKEKWAFLFYHDVKHPFWPHPLKGSY